MKLTLKPVEIPFTVGNTVFVNIPYSSLATDEWTDLAKGQDYFEAIILRIFLEGLKPTSVIDQPKERHELTITSLLYDLKPTGKHQGLARVAISVDTASNVPLLFATEKAIRDYAKKGAPAII